MSEEKPCVLLEKGLTPGQFLYQTMLLSAIEQNREFVATGKIASIRESEFLQTFHENLGFLKIITDDFLESAGIQSISKIKEIIADTIRMSEDQGDRYADKTEKAA